MRRFALLFACWALASPAAGLAAGAPRELHGSSDAFSAPGVIVAWGILRGADEASTSVVVRVATDPAAYPWLAVVAIDPFSGDERLVRAPAAMDGATDVRIPRPQFADFPHTAWRLYASAEAAPGRAPALVVVYHGVPDTTPEFADAAKLEAHLAARIARLRAAGGQSR